MYVQMCIQVHRNNYTRKYERLYMFVYICISAYVVIKKQAHQNQKYILLENHKYALMQLAAALTYNTHLATIYPVFSHMTSNTVAQAAVFDLYEHIGYKTAKIPLHFYSLCQREQLIFNRTQIFTQRHLLFIKYLCFLQV